MDFLEYFLSLHGVQLKHSSTYLIANIQAFPKVLTILSS